jgi:FkbM family methyltransferase
MKTRMENGKSAPVGPPQPASTGEDRAATKNESYDLLTFAVMKRALGPRANCVDVGCHLGSVLRVMLHVAPQGVHHAFEPLPDLFARLERDFGHLPNVQLHELALSDASGSVSFQHVTTHPAYSGFRPRRYPRGAERHEITVRRARLDEVLPRDLPVNFVKIDVEGAELEVLRGAVDTLRRHRPLVVFEHGLGAADFYGTDPGSLHDLLARDCGLQVSRLENWLLRGPILGRTAFCERFHRGLDYYFLAHPPRL